MKIYLRRLRIAFAGVFVLAILGMGWWVWSFGGRGSSTALPNPNGYDDLLRAGRYTTGQTHAVVDLSHDMLLTLVTTNAEALRILRVGLSHQCAVPTDAQIANFARVSRDVISLKSLATLLTAEGRLAEMENRPGDAAWSYVDAIRLGSEMSHGGFLINRLVGIACEKMGSTPFVKLVPSFTCEQLRPLIAALETIDQRTVPWQEVLENENRFMRAQLGNYPNPFKLMSELWDARHSRTVSAERHDLAVAQLRLLAAEIALRAYVCQNGKRPEVLSQLVPNYMQAVPKDPFGSGPLVYRPTGTNWVLYSVGPDGVDNGGKPVSKITSGDYLFGLSIGAKIPDTSKSEGDLFYDSRW